MPLAENAARTRRTDADSSSSSSGIFKTLDEQGSGSIELSFHQVRPNSPHYTHQNRNRNRNLSCSSLCLPLQWLNFAMI